MIRLVFLSLFLVCVVISAHAQTTQTNGQPSAQTNCPPITGDINSRNCISKLTSVSTDATNFGYAVSTQGPSSTVSLAATSNTTLGALPSLQLTLTYGGSYVCEGHLTVSSGAGGAKAGLVAADTRLTVTSMSRTIQVWSGSTFNAMNTATTLDATSGGVGNTSAVTDIYVTAGIVVNAGGTIAFEGAQNSSNGATTNFLINSTFFCVRAG